ncbi:MAG: hypothetical protein V8S08_01100 [Lachnoclostridium sp.]
MYRVIKHFIDLHDNDHSYEEGDIFPREGVAVLDERIAELAGSDNKQHTPLIELVGIRKPSEMSLNENAEVVNDPEKTPEETSEESQEEIPKETPGPKAKKTRSRKAEESPAE